MDNYTSLNLINNTIIDSAALTGGRKLIHKYNNRYCFLKIKFYFKFY